MRRGGGGGGGGRGGEPRPAKPAETGGWHQLPRDAGQTVGVTYAVGWESQTIYRRSVDHSDGSIEVEQAAVAGGQFEPQNGILPELCGEWRTIAGCYR